MKFKLGSVVSLKSNGLLLAAKHPFLSLGGNENFTTPLMVVEEILFDTQEELDEETGGLKVKNKGGNKYKCLYFSSKTMKFVDNWFNENELALYDTEDSEIQKCIDSNKLKWGDIVRFKTVDAEAGKKKSFNQPSRSKDTKSILTFTAPALQVIGFGSVDKKEPLIDPYNGKTKRQKSKKLVKCKFFNVELDKFSEQRVPIECLQKIDNTNIDNKLKKISAILNNKQLCLIELEDKKIFCRPISTHVISGRYQLLYWNELLKKNETLWLDRVKEIDQVDINKDSDYYPGFYDDNGTKKLITPQIFLDNNDLSDTLLKIVYKNLKEEIVSRYVFINEIQESLMEDDDSNKIYYLKSHCYLREAEREFRSDRFLSVRTIEDDNLITYLNELIQ